MDSEQRRKRKRTAKPTFNHSLYCQPSHSLPVRSLILCFAFVTFLYLLSHRIPIAPSVFRPVLVVSRIPLLSSYSRQSIRLYSDSIQSFKVEDRVLFPDHVLLIVSNWNFKENELVCVYSGMSFEDIGRLRRNVLSVDEYNEFQSIVRCPLPPPNYSAVVNLEIREEKRVNLNYMVEKLGNNRTVPSWEMVAYTATLDGNTVVVFVKGLNHRPDRESDPTQFTCHFGLGNWGRNGKYVLTTKAIAAAQEVVRCLLPRSIRMNPNKARGIRVAIGTAPHGHGRARGHVLVPSVAKIFDSKTGGLEKKRKDKHELCVCTMVWNQASALREWIAYHAWLGVERWFIYDNNSDDEIEEVIDELDLENYNVSRHVWPWIKTQEAGFSHCALRARDECHWVAFMDVDEYFYFPFQNFHNQGSRKLGLPGQSSLKTLVSNFSSSQVAEIRTACHSFGPSGLSSPPSRGVMIGYTCRLQSPERHKSIIRPDALDLTLLNVVHHFRVKKGFRYLNLPQSTAVINHYKYQVWESFRAKFYRRVATYVVDWQENQNEGSRDRAPGLGTEAIEPPNWRLKFCEIWDTGLRDFVLANLADPATGLLPWERNSQ